MLAVPIRLRPLCLQLVDRVIQNIYLCNLLIRFNAKLINNINWDRGYTVSANLSGRR